MTRGLWTRETIAMLLLAAYLPLTLFWLWFGGPEAAYRLGLVALIVAFWHLVFLLARAQPISLSAAIAALAMAILAPEDLGAFRLFLGISFGTVIGELIFGGWGRNVVNPSTVALSFLGFGFPAFPWPDFVEPVAWAAIATALIGAATGAMPAAVIASGALLAAGSVASGLLPASALPAAGIVFVLLVSDPATSATTTLGQWLNGALFAALVTLFAGNWSGAAPVQYAVSAALLTSLTVPALDEAALALWYARRRRLHGKR